MSTRTRQWRRHRVANRSGRYPSTVARFVTMLRTYAVGAVSVSTRPESSAKEFCVRSSAATLKVGLRQSHLRRIPAQVENLEHVSLDREGRSAPASVRDDCLPTFAPCQARLRGGSVACSWRVSNRRIRRWTPGDGTAKRTPGWTVDQHGIELAAPSMDIASSVQPWQLT